MIARFTNWWEEMKLAFGATLGVTQDGAHVCVGTGGMFALLFILRGRPVLAWTLVLLAELVNEAIDLLGSRREGTFVASLHDVILTMIGPTLLLLVLRRHRRAGGR